MSTGQDRALKLEALNNEYESLITEKASIERSKEMMSEKLSTSRRFLSEAEEKFANTCAELDQAASKLAEIKKATTPDNEEEKEGADKNIREQEASIAVLKAKIINSGLEVEKCKNSLDFGRKKSAELDMQIEVISSRAAEVAIVMHELSKQ